MDQYYDSSLNGCSHHAPCCFIDNASLKTLVSSPLTSLLLYQFPLEGRFWIGLVLDKALGAMVNVLFAKFVPLCDATLIGMRILMGFQKHHN
jgi:hypothetical protein